MGPSRTFHVYFAGFLLSTLYLPSLLNCSFFVQADHSILLGRVAYELYITAGMISLGGCRIAESGWMYGFTVINDCLIKDWQYMFELSWQI